MKTYLRLKRIPFFVHGSFFLELCPLGTCEGHSWAQANYGKEKNSMSAFFILIFQSHGNNWGMGKVLQYEEDISWSSLENHKKGFDYKWQFSVYLHFYLAFFTWFRCLICLFSLTHGILLDGLFLKWILCSHAQMLCENVEVDEKRKKEGRKRMEVQKSIKNHLLSLPQWSRKALWRPNWKKRKSY